MRSAVTRLKLAQRTRRAWQQQQQAGSERMEAFLSPSPIISPLSSSPPPLPQPSFSSTSTHASSHASSSPSPSPTTPTPTPLHLLDRVFVSRMPFFARHGVHPAEAELGQRFEVDAEVFVDGLARSVLAEGEAEGEQASSSGPNSSGSSPPPADSVSRTFDYSRIHAVAQAVVRDGPRAQLVETLAARIADALLKEEGARGGGAPSSSLPSPSFEVVGARVRVTKPGAPIPGVFGEAGCEVVRWKERRR